MGFPPGLVSLRAVEEVLKELPLVNVPLSFQPCRPNLRGQLFQASDVFRLLRHQGFVVLHQCLNEGVVLRVLVRLISLIDEKPLEVSVAGATRIQGVVGALGEVVGSTHTGINLNQPAFLELSGFIGKPNVILCALVLA